MASYNELNTNTLQRYDFGTYLGLIKEGYAASFIRSLTHVYKYLRHITGIAA